MSPEGSRVRTFIAIDIPPEAKDRLAAPVRELQACCRAANLPASWSRREGWHLTIKFLGSVDTDRLDLITRRLPEVIGLHHPLMIHLSGLGSFPSGRRPRVIWVGIEESEGKRALAALTQGIESVLVELGFLPDERAFNPHLTLARIKTPCSVPQLVDLLERARLERFSEVRVDQVVLMQSELRHQGARYTPLATFPLREENHCG